MFNKCKDPYEIMKMKKISEENDPYKSTLINCKHCSRKFAEKALERHEDVCKNVINKPKP